MKRHIAGTEQNTGW